MKILRWCIVFVAALSAFVLVRPVIAGPLACSELSTDPNSDKCMWEVDGSEYVLPYYRYHDLTTYNANITRAVIAIHGRSYDPSNYRDHIYNAANARGALGTTVIIAPYFCGCNNTCDPDWLCWSGGADYDYPDGGAANNDHDNLDTSSFAILDDIISHLATSGNFPNLQTVVVTGQSGGGQTTLRYAMGGASAPAGITVRYVACNPGGVTYLNGNRPTQASIDAFPNIVGDPLVCDPISCTISCNSSVSIPCTNDPICTGDLESNPPSGAIGELAGLESWSEMPYEYRIPYGYEWGGTECYSDGSYDAWPWGLGDISTNTYMTTRVGSGHEARSRYLSREVILLFGINDNHYEDIDHAQAACRRNSEWGCQHASQGQTRVERGTIFFNHVCDSYDCSNHGFATVMTDTNGDGVLDRIGHGGTRMYQSEATRSVLFDDVKPPSICYQKPLRGRPGRWMRISLKHLEHDFPAGSTLEVEPGEGYAVWRRGLRGHNWIRPDINFRGRLSVPVQVRSPIPNAPLHGTFISNTYFLKVSVDTKMKWLFPAVLGGEILLDDAD